jgi:phage-related protein
MTTPYMILTDDKGTVYNFPPSIFLKGQKVSVNSSIQKLLYAHGGREIADGYLQARQISLEGTLYADSLSAFETKKRTLVQAILKGGKLSISNDTVSRYISVRLIDYDPDMEYQTFDNIGISFIVEFPFWEDTSETTHTEIVTGNDSFVVDTTGSDDLILPIIEVEADQSVDVSSIKMYNYNDGGLAFEYNDPNMFASDIVVFDSKLGTVKKNGNDSMIYFNPAYFLRLQPGSNTIYYEGAAATIRIKYRKVYI